VPCKQRPLPATGRGRSAPYDFALAVKWKWLPLTSNATSCQGETARIFDAGLTSAYLGKAQALPELAIEFAKESLRRLL
jgi:hypothetical protein